MFPKESSNLSPPDDLDRGESRCRVLLVDDDMALLELVREYLDTDAGRFEVCTALTGDQAFVRLVDFTPDVVVLDVCLPDMNGIEIMNQIQDIHPQAHVVVLTGNGTPEQRAIALREGAVRFLEKPVDLPGFKRLLLELGRRKKEMGGLEGGNMDILDLVQMMYVCQKSTSIRFVYKRRRGTLRFERGEAVYIDDGSTTGDQAFFNMVLLWGEGRFYTLSEESAGILEQNNWRSTASLLMDAVFVREEQQFPPQPATLTNIESSPTSAQTPQAGSKDPNAASAEVPVEVAAEVPPDAPTLRLDLPTLKELMQSLVRVDGARMAVLVDWDGFVLEGQSRGGKSSMEALGAVISTGLGSTQVIGRELHVGGASLAMLEFEKGTVLVRVIGDLGILAVLVENQANLGLMRYQIKKVAPEIEAAMKG